MIKSNFIKVFLVTVLCFSISHFPEIAAAQAARGMISTTEVVESLGRAEIEANIQRYLNREDLRNELKKVGLSADEISKRMASLSAEELKQLNKQMDEARYGGDVIGILLVVLLVLLIIYFAKRV